MYSDAKRVESIEEALRLLKEGRSLAGIAQDVGVSYLTLQRWLRKVGIDWGVRGTPAKVDRDRALDMYKKGFSFAAIGREFGVGRERIRQICTEGYVKSRGKKKPPLPVDGSLEKSNEESEP